MAPHSSTLAWKIPWTEEPCRLQSMGSLGSDFTFTFHFHALEKEVATHSSVLAWRIPGTGEPGGLPSMGRTESDTTEATQQQSKVKEKAEWCLSGAGGKKRIRSYCLVSIALQFSKVKGVQEMNGGDGCTKCDYT